MLPKLSRNEKQNFTWCVLFVAVLLFSCAVGCFQQAAPERLAEARNLEELAATAATAGFARLSLAVPDGEKLAAFPGTELAACPNLRKVSLRGQTALAPLPEAPFGSLPKLEWLDLSAIGLTDLPASLAAAGVRELWLAENKFTSLPPAVSELTALAYLNLDRNLLGALPPEIGNLTSLRWLRLNFNRLETLPAECSNLKELDRLYLRSNRIREFPAALLSLTGLEQLDLSDNKELKELPEGISAMRNLERLDLSGCGIEKLPDGLASAPALKTLVLVGCPLDPAEVARFKKLAKGRSPGTLSVEF